MHAFNVWLANKLINTVFYSIGKKETIKSALESVKNSLINHDGLNPEIRVTWPKGQRLTVDSWELWGDYGHGFELLTADASRRAILANKKDYLENAPCPMKILKKRERV